MEFLLVSFFFTFITIYRWHSCTITGNATPGRR